MSKLIQVLSLIFICIAIWFGWKLHAESQLNTEYQYDYAEINKINYGLFNVALWKEKAINIFQKRILEFTVSEEAYNDLDRLFEGYINNLYTDYIESGGLADEIVLNLEKSGNLNPLFLNLIKDNLSSQLQQLDLKSKIPVLTNRLNQEIRANESVLISYLQEELLRLLIEGSETNFIERRVIVYQKYGFDNPEETLSFLRNKINGLNQSITYLIWKSLGCLLVSFLILVLSFRSLPFREFIFGLTTVSIVLLVLGVTLPMIDIDARLNSFLLQMMGSEISFDEQILYFQSKSILDVTQTLIQGHGWDLKLVGVLIFLFSIVFPFFKLLLSTLYLYWNRIKHNKLAQGIIFYLGKWSMADVFTVAMFMAYIGFYGLVTSQLGEIGRNPNGYAVETVNYSRLSPGALFFTTYCILSIVISLLINRNEVSTRVSDEVI